jgi:hypothetical protein
MFLLLFLHLFGNAQGHFIVDRNSLPNPQLRWILKRQACASRYQLPKLSWLENLLLENTKQKIVRLEIGTSLRIETEVPLTFLA